MQSHARNHDLLARGDSLGEPPVRVRQVRPSDPKHASPAREQQPPAKRWEPAALVRLEGSLGT